jgi:hypothetical protein
MTDNDFKYMLQDIYRLYFGVKSSYRELMENEDTYTRFKAVCRQYLMEEVDPETTLESHLYYLTPDQPAAEVYAGLGARIKLNVPVVQKGLFRKEQRIYKEEIWSVEELMALTAQQKQFRGIVLSELQISKRKLREFVI